MFHQLSQNRTFQKNKIKSIFRVAQSLFGKDHIINGVSVHIGSAQPKSKGSGGGGGGGGGGGNERGGGYGGRGGSGGGGGGYDGYQVPMLYDFFMDVI